MSTNHQSLALSRCRNLCKPMIGRVTVTCQVSQEPISLFEVDKANHFQYGEEQQEVNSGNPFCKSKIHEGHPPAMSVVLPYYAQPIPKSRAGRNLCPARHRNFSRAFVLEEILRPRCASTDVILLVEREESDEDKAAIPDVSGS